MYGATKYGKWNWRSGMPWSELLDSAQRHQDDWWEGTDVDYESGLHHLDHAIADLIFLRWYTKFKLKLDDRPPNPTNLYAEEGTVSPELLHHWEELKEHHEKQKLHPEDKGQS